METKRMLLFLVGCIGMRTLLTVTSIEVTKIQNGLLYLKYMGYVAVFISMGFIYLYVNGNKYADNQLSQYKDKKLWWKNLRIVHGIMYSLFALFAIQMKSYAWVPLALDTIIGLSVWTFHNYPFMS